jgi:hypothetical protein
MRPNATEEVIMLDGIYSTSFVGSAAAGSGVVIIEGGRIMGGDTSFVYRGKLRHDENNGIIATVDVEKHNNTLASIFGGLNKFRLNLNGVVASTGDGLMLSGQVLGKPELMIAMELKKLGELVDEER